MSKKIRIGVLGMASIARRMMIPAIMELSDLYDLVGVATRRHESDQIYKNMDGVRLFHGYDSLLDEQLDAIYIPLPNSLHYTWIKKYLDNGTHVLVEKSLACTVSEVVELNKIARDRGLVLLENFQFRFHPQFSFIQEQLKVESLGCIRNLSAAFGFPPFPDNNNIRYDRELGGGALFDAGAYPVKVAQLLMGKDIIVDAASLGFKANHEVDIFGSASLRNAVTGVVMQASWGFDNFYRNRIEIWGSHGYLCASRIFTAGPGVDAIVTVEKKDITESYKFVGNHFTNMLAHFASLVGTNRNRDFEYTSNVTQANLLDQVVEKSKSFS